jgi:hypothetical protein
MLNESLGWLVNLGDALLLLLMQPLLYVGIVISILQVRRQIVLERKLFHGKLHSLISETWRTIAVGIGVGVILSLVMVGVGISFTLGGAMWIWGITLVLMWFRVRFLCHVYAVGIVGLLQAALTWMPESFGGELVQSMLEPLRSVAMPALLFLMAVMLLLEAAIIRWQGHRKAGPMLFEGRRGKVIGGYQLQNFWIVPVFLLVPNSTGGFALPWDPLFAGQFTDPIGGWTWLGVPLLMGITDWTTSVLPRTKLRRSAFRLAILAIVLLAASIGALYVPVLVVPVSLLAIILHELIVWRSRHEESNRSPYFVHSTQGLKIIAVLPGSPADEMGIMAGEIIQKVNQMSIATKSDLHEALRLNSAFCKLELLTTEGQSKKVSRAMFSNEHHQLGILLCPDDDSEFYLANRKREASFGLFLRRKWFGLSRVKESSSINQVDV